MISESESKHSSRVLEHIKYRLQRLNIITAKSLFIFNYLFFWTCDEFSDHPHTGHVPPTGTTVNKPARGGGAGEEDSHRIPHTITTTTAAAGRSDSRLIVFTT